MNNLQLYYHYRWCSDDDLTEKQAAIVDFLEGFFECCALNLSARKLFIIAKIINKLCGIPDRRMSIDSFRDIEIF